MSLKASQFSDGGKLKVAHVFIDRKKTNRATVIFYNDQHLLYALKDTGATWFLAHEDDIVENCFFDLHNSERAIDLLREKALVAEIQDLKQQIKQQKGHEECKI